MNKELEERINNFLIQEAKDAIHGDCSREESISKMNDIYNLKKIIDEYDELEPILRGYFAEKERRKKDITR